MKLHTALTYLAIELLTCAGIGAQENKGMLFDISAGSATFASPTNISGVEVTGKSNSLTGQVEVFKDAAGLSIQNIRAVVPVRTLLTGMKVRDEHMRKYIFTTTGGQEPDLVFEAEKTICPAQDDRDFTCKVTGTLSIRGTPEPFQITLSVKDTSGSQQNLRAVGESVVKLSAYGIAPPTQLGVHSSDEVKLRLEFTGKQKATLSSSAGNPR